MLRSFILLIFGLIAFNGAYTDQNIEIIGGMNAGNPKIAIVNFANDSTNSLADIIADDLSITGEFNVKRYANKDEIENGTQYILTGDVANNNLVKYKLNGSSKNTLINQSISYKTDARKGAHTISNNVYQKITNVKGVFTTKIAYIVKSSKSYSLIVSDYDGYNQKSIFSANSPITSLAWNNNGQQIAYVSFETGKPVTYVQNIYKGDRYPVANFSGSNSSPAFSPDGKKLAVTLSKDGGSHIYLISNKAYSKSSIATPLINYDGSTIDTEASFANNGNMIFTSNHDGGPQIFMSTINGGTPSRLTFGLGRYNTSAKFSHDASKITFINRNAGVLKAYVMDLATKTAYPVSLKSSLDMAPSFAPNDKLVLFSSSTNGMYISNVTGTSQTQLKNITGDTIIDQQWANNY